mgnify:CR=1 FL=1
MTPELAKKALRAVKDPELGLNVIDIGLIYDVAVADDGAAKVTMTLTSPGCPSGAEIMEDVRRTLADLEVIEHEAGGGLCRLAADRIAGILLCGCIRHDYYSL